MKTETYFARPCRQIHTVLCTVRPMVMATDARLKPAVHVNAVYIGYLPARN